MPEQGEGIADEPNLKYFVVSWRFGGLWFVDLHECWAHNCSSERRMCTNRLLIKKVVGCHIVEVFVLPPCGRLMMYAPVPDFWICWEPSHFLFVSSPSIFPYYCGLTLHGSEADKAHVW